MFYAAFMDEMKKVAEGRIPATIVGGLAGPLAGLASEKGKGWRTAGGALLGHVTGSTLGSLAGMATKNPLARILLANLGGAAGGAGGAYLAHGKDTLKKAHARAK